MAAAAFLFAILCLLCCEHLAQSNSLERHKHRSYVGFITRKKCYGELGCFSTGGDFADILRRPLQLLPKKRSDIDTNFHLYDRKEEKRGRLLKAGDIDLLKQADFEPQKPLKFLIHGFLSKTSSNTYDDIMHDLLKREDVNVITVNWIKGAKPPYTQATANARLVGAEIAHLIKFLKNSTQGLELEKIHLIGHSLGAHIAGYAGKYFKKPKLGRVTGLDPAGPYFEGMKPAVRIDRGDANFVDVIHTNGESIFKASFGMQQAVGHADFYFNGGAKQPGCGVKDSISKIKETSLGKIFSCSHNRAKQFFKTSILSKCPLLAYRCSDYDNFKRGECLTCRKPGDCIFVGMNATKTDVEYASGSQKYFLDTGANHPFCGHHYKVDIAFNKGTKRHTARFALKFIDRRGQVIDELKIPHSDDKWFDILPQGHAKATQFFKRNHGPIDGLSFWWEKKRTIWKPSSWFGTHRIRVDHITISDTDRNVTQKFCSGQELNAKEFYYLKPCQ